MTAFTGRVVKVGDDLNTDMILPGAYLNLTEPGELAPHLLETYPDPEVPRMITAGDILVAGRNCGSGSSREHAQLALLGRGVQAVVAVSFARIFLRNCLNLGLLAIEQPEAATALHTGESLTVDVTARLLSWAGGEARMPAQPAFLKEMLASGGLVGWVHGRLQERST